MVWLCYVGVGDVVVDSRPDAGDSKIKSGNDILFGALQRDHGFNHLDLDPGNVIYLPGKE